MRAPPVWVPVMMAVDYLFDLLIEACSGYMAVLARVPGGRTTVFAVLELIVLFAVVAWRYHETRQRRKAALPKL